MPANLLVERPTTEPAEAPPAARPARDLTVDLLRAIAIVAVAVGHWLVVVPSYADHRFDGVNALETVPAMRPLTWVFQVMPLFFVVGGVANAASWAGARRRGETYATWLRSRLVRLVRPAAWFFAVAAGLAAALRAAGLTEQVVAPVAWLVVVPVWFLSVYVMVVAIAPPLWRLHRRHGTRVVVALTVAAVAVDAVRLAGYEAVGYLNFLLVFGVAQQLGFAWYDGRLLRFRDTAWALLVGGLGALWLLTHVGPYPVSLVGYPGPELDNNAPPTITLIALGVAQTGLALVLRPWLQRAMTLRPVQAFTLALNRNAMTVLLWHFTALVLVAVVALPLGLVPDHEWGTAAWWWTRVVLLPVYALALVPLVALAGRVERDPGNGPPRPWRSWAPVVAVPVLAVAFGLITLGGLSGPGPLGVPVASVALFGGGSALALSGRPDA